LATIFAAAAEDDLTIPGDVIEQVVEVGAGLSAGGGSLAAGADTDGRTEAGPVAGGLGGADGDQYGGDAAGGLGCVVRGGGGRGPNASGKRPDSLAAVEAGRPGSPRPASRG
jgi:hypothetical protein